MRKIVGAIIAGIIAFSVPYFLIGAFLIFFLYGVSNPLGAVLYFSHLILSLGLGIITIIGILKEQKFAKYILLVVVSFAVLYAVTSVYGHLRDEGYLSF